MEKRIFGQSFVQVVYNSSANLRRDFSHIRGRTCGYGSCGRSSNVSCCGFGRVLSFLCGCSIQEYPLQCALCKLEIHLPCLCLMHPVMQTHQALNSSMSANTQPSREDQAVSKQNTTPPQSLNAQSPGHKLFESPPRELDARLNRSFSSIVTPLKVASPSRSSLSTPSSSPSNMDIDSTPLGFIKVKSKAKAHILHLLYQLLLPLLTHRKGAECWLHPHQTQTTL